jgi:hypothetical protein
MIGALSLGATLSLRAAIIFDNSVNDLLTRFDPGTTEVGDEILLAGTEQYLTGFSFEFWGVNAVHPNRFDGAVEARVRFYENNGPLVPPDNGYASPGTVLYDSNWFSVGSLTARSTFVFIEGLDFPSGGLFIPTSDMTWSVQFRGMGMNDHVGVDIYSPPVVGVDYPDYWADDGGWALLTNTVPMNFAARMEASETGVVLPRPRLGLTLSANQAVLSWPVTATNFILETANTLSSASWSPLTNRMAVSGISFVHTNPITTPTAFYRLRKQY